MSKRWIAIIGSSRKGKNSETLVDYIAEVLKEYDIEVDKFVIPQKLTGCNGCEYCIDHGVCHIDDEMNSWMKQMNIVDGYIFVSPVYNYTVSGQMKIFLDRTFCLNDYSDGWKSRLSKGKKAIFAAVAISKHSDTLNQTIGTMQVAIEELGVESIETITYCNTKQLPVWDNNQIKSELKEHLSQHFGK